MATVRDVLNRKGHDVYHVDPDASVLAALEIMAEHDIGALVVLDNGDLVGIIIHAKDCLKRTNIAHDGSPGDHVDESDLRPTRSNRGGMHGHHDGEGCAPSPGP